MGKMGDNTGRAGTRVTHTLVSPRRQRPGDAVALGRGTPSAAPQPRAEGHVLTPLPGGNIADQRRKEEAAEHQPSFPGTAGVRWVFLGATAARPSGVISPPPWGEHRMAGTCRDEGAIPTHALGEDLGEGVFLPPRGGGIFFFWGIWQNRAQGVRRGDLSPRRRSSPRVFLAECGVHCDVLGTTSVSWPFLPRDPGAFFKKGGLGSTAQPQQPPPSP